ncbi:MAG: S8 family serine peptidase [Bacteroidota bacterium]
MKTNALPLICFICLCLWSTTTRAQHDLLLKSGTIVPAENLQNFIAQAQIEEKEIFEGHFYRLLQFQSLPDIEKHERIAQTGIQLLEYLPHLTYLAAIPADLDLSTLAELEVRSILDYDQNFKLDNNLVELPYGDWAIHGDKIGAILKYHNNLEEAQVLTRMAADGIQLVQTNHINNFLYVHLNPEDLDAIAQLPYIAYLSLEDAPGEPEDVLGRSLHRANTLDTGFPGGRQYTGEGINIMVRDDGRVGPHIDFQGRNLGPVTNDNGTHGDGVAGIMCGAGNLDPRNRGMAAGSDMFVLNYVANFLDQTLPLHISDDVLVTNSSYSNGCNVGYTNTTATVDQQMNDNPTFLHVFSAGNSNNLDCGYGAGDQWGNITGGHKQGKNVIATANVFSDGSLVNSSSRGPAHDGRIKPDIAAHGQGHVSTNPNNTYAPFGGTSGAAPGIAGITAQLHQAYRELNGGETADAALLKAVLMNSASDYGNIGPDFRFGWGIVNAYRAVLTLEEDRHFTGAVAPNETQTHSIEIPEGVRQVKIMTYWREREANTNVAKALINNLDTRVTFGGETHLPWVLDPTPNPITLDMPAGKGVDDLNNVEQVAIDNPAAGTYTLEVSGTELPFGTHDYIVVYEFETAQPTVIYPIGGEGLVPGETARIHWDAFGNDGNFMLDYSVDGGSTWTPIGEANADQRMRNWNVPDEFTGEARVRVTRGMESDRSDANFSITRLPTGLNFAAAWEDVITLEWTGVEGVLGYEIFVLGEKYMDPVGVSMETTFEYTTTDIMQVHWFAVRAIGDNGIISRRTNAVQFVGGLINCIEPEILIGASSENVCAFDQVDFSSFATEISLDYSWNFGPSAIPPVSFSQNPVNIRFLAAGEYTVSVTATNDLGSTTSTIDISVSEVPDAQFEVIQSGLTVDFNNLTQGVAVYNWNFGDGGSSTQTNPTHTFSEPGTYTVSLAAFNTCGNSTSTVQVTVTPTSTENVLPGYDLSVAPNPNKGTFDLLLDSPESNRLQWQMFNLHGQNIKGGQIITTPGFERHRIDASSLPTGVYLLRLSNEEGAQTVKVTIF